VSPEKLVELGEVGESAMLMAGGSGDALIGLCVEPEEVETRESGRCMTGAALGAGTSFEMGVWTPLEVCGIGHETLGPVKDGLRSRLGGCQFLDVRLRRDAVSDPCMLGAARVLLVSG
jgi:hypothetical protein